MLAVYLPRQDRATDKALLFYAAAGLQILIFLVTQQAQVLFGLHGTAPQPFLWQHPDATLSLMHNAGSHDVEVSSGVHGRQAATTACLPSRFSKEAPAGNDEQEALSLQTLAAAADSGVFLTQCLHQTPHCHLINLSISVSIDVSLRFLHMLQAIGCADILHRTGGWCVCACAKPPGIILSCLCAELTKTCLLISAGCAFFLCRPVFSSCHHSTAGLILCR